jgi:hypothetical protein
MVSERLRGKISMEPHHASLETYRGNFLARALGLGARHRSNAVFVNGRVTAVEAFRVLSRHLPGHAVVELDIAVRAHTGDFNHGLRIDQRQRVLNLGRQVPTFVGPRSGGGTPVFVGELAGRHVATAGNQKCEQVPEPMAVDAASLVTQIPMSLRRSLELLASVASSSTIMVEPAVHVSAELPIAFTVAMATSPAVHTKPSTEFTPWTMPRLSSPMQEPVLDKADAPLMFIHSNVSILRSKYVYNFFEC